MYPPYKMFHVQHFIIDSGHHVVQRVSGGYLSCSTASFSLDGTCEDLTSKYSHILGHRGFGRQHIFTADTVQPTVCVFDDKVVVGDKDARVAWFPTLALRLTKQVTQPLKTLGVPAWEMGLIAAPTSSRLLGQPYGCWDSHMGSWTM